MVVFSKLISQGQGLARGSWGKSDDDRSRSILACSMTRTHRDIFSTRRLCEDRQTPFEHLGARKLIKSVSATSSFLKFFVDVLRCTHILPILSFFKCLPPTIDNQSYHDTKCTHSFELRQRSIEGRYGARRAGCKWRVDPERSRRAKRRVGRGE